MDVPKTRRILLLGKSGVGKSSLANTIFGEAKFQINNFTDLKTQCSHAETKSVNGRSITLIDTPGFFDAERSEEEMKPEIVKCITECAPGPHAFLIVLKVERFTEQEQAVITRICEYFSEDALKYAVIVFTHGDELPEEMKIEEYVSESEGLSGLVKKCGGRCHIVDNKYWKNSQQDEYRSNLFQVAELLKTIDKMVTENNGECYTNEMFQEVEKNIQKEEERIRRTTGNMSEEEIRRQAKSNVLKKQNDDTPRTWFRSIVGFTVIAGLLAVASAVLIKSAKVMPEALNQDLMNLSVEVTEPVPEIKPDILKDLTPPVEVLCDTFTAVMGRLDVLYERTYDPWSLFE